MKYLDIQKRQVHRQLRQLRLEVPRGWGRGNGEFMLNGYRVPFGAGGKISKPDRGDGVTTL